VSELDHDACYRACQARDPRFDGRLFVGVKTTGIYCRPVCPARTPKSENCRFFSSAAAAQEAGFRPCLRCRPERSPEVPAYHGTASTVSRAVALIGEGALDGEDANVATLALRVGMGERQLRRLFEEHLGASPLAVAQTRRVLFAKQLIQETRLPMVEVAQASGFRSVRRFNDTFHKLYGRPPRELRRLGASDAKGGMLGPVAKVTLRLAYRPPYDWSAMSSFLAARAIAGVEEVTADTYRRTIQWEGQSGFIEIAPLQKQNCLAATISFPEVRSLPSIVARIRRLFDVDADIQTINQHLSLDPLLSALVARRRGLRVPGGWDGFEVAVRAILGQQVTVTAARALAGRLTAAFGDRVAMEGGAKSALTHVFPTPPQVANADLEGIGLTPGARVRALRALAQRAAEDPTLFGRAASLDAAVARFRAIPGIGDWTAHYIALRALREPDAFPVTDVGILRGATLDNAERVAPDALRERAERWRPWRAYAAQHLWARDGDLLQDIREEKEILHARATTFSRRFATHAPRPDARRL
jgi:AraC family transcriptional regulator of adaptative response / DNA-3-methyladenine glycosylase II